MKNHVLINVFLIQNSQNCPLILDILAEEEQDYNQHILFTVFVVVVVISGRLSVMRKIL